MSRASIIKRLEAVEANINSGVSIVVWGGLPPIHVQITKGIGADCKPELKLFDSMEEIEHFMETNYPYVDALMLHCGEGVSSADLHRWAK